MENPTTGAPATPSLADNLGDTSKLDTFFSKFSDGADTATEETVDSTPAESSTDETVEFREETPTPKAEIVDSDSQVEPESTKPAITAQGALTPNKKGRDFTGIAEEDIPYFKQMSDKSFNYFKPKYLEHKTWQDKYKEVETNYNGVKDHTFWQHPEAYRLSEDYTKLSSDARLQSQIATHWQNQLINWKSGQPIYDLVPDGKGGYTYSEPKPFDKDNEVNMEMLLRDAYDKAKMEAYSINQKLSTVKDGYAAKYKNFEGFLDKVDKEVLGMVREAPEFKTLETEMLNRLPPELRGSKQYQLLAGLGAFVRLQSNITAHLKEQLNGKNVIRKVAKANGPSAATPTKDANGDTSGETVADFRKSFKQYVNG